MYVCFCCVVHMWMFTGTDTESWPMKLERYDARPPEPAPAPATPTPPPPSPTPSPTPVPPPSSSESEEEIAMVGVPTLSAPFPAGSRFQNFPDETTLNTN
eukprot:COSAG05_NODE_597_length_8449_cov_615.285389_9_plen_100_part_00